jgi:hypothetical protein
LKLAKKSSKRLEVKNPKILLIESAIMASSGFFTKVYAVTKKLKSTKSRTI